MRGGNSTAGARFRTVLHSKSPDVRWLVAPPPGLAYAAGAMATAALPLFHLYGDPPDDQAFDFIHIETIAARSTVHDWTIRAHRHRNLFQVLVIEAGGGEMSYETASVSFASPAVLLVPPRVAHGFRFTPQVTAGWWKERRPAATTC